MTKKIGKGADEMIRKGLVRKNIALQLARAQITLAQAAALANAAECTRLAGELSARFEKEQREIADSAAILRRYQAGQVCYDCARNEIVAIGIPKVGAEHMLALCDREGLAAPVSAHKLDRMRTPLGLIDGGLSDSQVRVAA